MILGNPENIHVFRIIFFLTKDIFNSKRTLIVGPLIISVNIVVKGQVKM